LRKGPNLTGVEPDTDEIVRLYRPRRDEWEEHFAFVGLRIVGKTPIGRTTAWLFAMNDPERVRIRALGRAAD
jgi:hypothetical protein